MSTAFEFALEEEMRKGDVDVGPIVAQLSNLRSASQKRRYRRTPPQLPSRESLVQITERLVSALYPRHFGPSGLSAADADSFVAQTLRTTLRALQRQVSHELVVSKEWHEGQHIPPVLNAHEITVKFAESLPTIRALLDADIRAAYESDPSAKSIDEIVFCFPSVAAISRYRMAHELYVLGAPMIARIVSEIAHSQTGIDIHPGARIGRSFFIDHGTGVVIGETAIIGRNVRLYQGVTLGAKRFEADEQGRLIKHYPRHPIVEDDVVIYPGATILGRVTIGKGSTIGGNVCLTRSVPPGSRVTQVRAGNGAADEGDGI